MYEPLPKCCRKTRQGRACFPRLLRFPAEKDQKTNRAHLTRVNCRPPERKAVLFEPGSRRIGTIAYPLPLFRKPSCLVVDDISELKLDFGVPDALDERIERAAHCFQALSIRKLCGDSRTFPSRTERSIPPDDQTIADFRNRNPRAE